MISINFDATWELLCYSSHFNRMDSWIDGVGGSLESEDRWSRRIDGVGGSMESEDPWSEGVGGSVVSEDPWCQRESEDRCGGCRLADNRWNQRESDDRWVQTGRGLAMSEDWWNQRSWICSQSISQETGQS